MCRAFPQQSARSEETKQLNLPAQSRLPWPLQGSCGHLLLIRPKGTRGLGRDGRANKAPSSPWPGPGRAPAGNEPGWGAARRGCEAPITLPGLGSGSRGPCQDRESQATGSWQEGRVSSDMCSLKLATKTSWPRAQVSLSQPQLPTSLPPTGLKPWRWRGLPSAPGAREKQRASVTQAEWQSLGEPRKKGKSD